MVAQTLSLSGLTCSLLKAICALLRVLTFVKRANVLHRLARTKRRFLTQHRPTAFVQASRLASSEYTSFPFVVRGDNLSEAICKRHRARRHFSHRRRQRPRSHTLRGIPILCLYNKTPLVAISTDLCQYSLLPHSHRSRQTAQCLQPRLIRQQNIPQHSRRPRPVLASMRLIVHGRRPDAPARPIQQQNLFIAIPTGLG